jgi:hypothetical protein
MATVTIRFETPEDLGRKRVEREVADAVQAVKWAAHGGPRRVVADPETVTYTIDYKQED